MYSSQISADNVKPVLGPNTPLVDHVSLSATPMARNWQHANETIFMTMKRLLHSLRSQYLILSDLLVNLRHTTSVTYTMRSAFDPAIFTEYWQLNSCYVDPHWQRQGVGMLALS
jgi:hypothetical protein